MCDRRHVIAVVLAGALAAGCGEGTTEPPATAEPLSADESVALFRAFEVFQNDALEVEPSPLEANVDVTADCPLGGQVRVTGTADVQTAGDTLGIVVDVNVVPNECRLSQAGLEFTIDGAPGVHDRLSVYIIPSAELFDIRVEGMAVGTLDWRLADRSGRCAIEMALRAPDLSAPEPTITATWSGTLCGHAVEIPADSGFLPTG
ncbi:hypothetical protein [Candidatus Palauibacter sp.]|uniref:hypothetical protein n=1 Tax=Candidatus Palauibacter sp. TaxID=3101350 RepID=UPI003B02807C